MRWQTRGHTGFIAFSAVPELTLRRVRDLLRLSRVHSLPIIGLHLLRRWAESVGASHIRPCWTDARLPVRHFNVAPHAECSGSPEIGPIGLSLLTLEPRSWPATVHRATFGGYGQVIHF